MAGGAFYAGDGITYFDLDGFLDAGDDVAHVSGAYLVFGLFFEFERAYFIGQVGFPRGHELDLFPLADRAVDDFEIGFDPAEWVVNGIEYQCFQGSLGIARRGGDAFDDGAQDVFDALSGFTGSQDDVLRGTVDQVDDVVRHLFRIGRGQIYLVEYRNDGQPVFQCQVQV